jgi:hypothetical protein
VNAARTLGALMISLSVTACSFNPHGLESPDELLPFRDDTPISAATSGERTMVYESPGLLAVFHGSSCAESDRSGEEIPMRIQEELVLPRELDQATVLLNGFRLRYLDDDHHVGGLGTAIGAIEIDRGVLHWEAGGAISDNDFNDGYEWCYTYTVLAWNSLQLQATVDHGDMGHAFRDIAWTHGSSLLPVPGYLSNPAWAGLDEVAVLPRGFGVLGGGDHHVLQFAYEHDSGEVYVEGKKQYGNFTEAAPVSQVGTGFVSWETTGLIKDNDLENPQAVLDLVTGLGGPEIDLVAPPFTVAPREDASGLGCNVIDGYAHVAEHEVQDVPFQFAIPVLTGWDLAYLCEDEHVAQIGAWIPKWEWHPGTSAGGGTLRYTVVGSLRDKDGHPGFHQRTQVKILGLRRITTMPPK